MNNMLSPQELQQYKDSVKANPIKVSTSNTDNSGAAKGQSMTGSDWAAYADHVANTAKDSTQNDTPKSVPGGLTGHVIPVANAQTFKNVGNALISSEKGVGETVGQGAALNSKDFNEAQQSKDQANKMLTDLEISINKKKESGEDTSHMEALYNKVKGTLDTTGDVHDIAPATEKTKTQALGEVAGVGLDMLSGGAASEGAKSFTLAKDVVKGSEVAKDLTTTQKVVKIAKATAKTSAEGAALGYGYDVANSAKDDNLSFKPGLGTAAGVAAPLVIGGVKIAGAISKEEGPRIINSLIGTRKGDFKYGKNPGRAVAESGIVANNLPEFESKITQGRQTTGSTIGELNSKLEGKAEVNISESLKPIDEAIKTANNAPRTNASLIQRLQNVKDDLLGLTQDASGKTIASRDLNDPSFANAFSLKKTVGDITKFTGNVSDDSAVNGALKQVYGNIKGAMNDAAVKADPELGRQLIKANERYADFTSAEVALRNRIALNQGKNLVSMPIKVGSVAGLVATLGTGVGIIPVLTAVGSAILDKALGSTAVKTRVAAWLSKESPEVVAGIVEHNPGIGSVLKKFFTKEYTPIENLLNDAKNLPNKEGGFARTPDFASGKEFGQKLSKSAIESIPSDLNKQEVIDAYDNLRRSKGDGTLNINMQNDIETFLTKVESGNVTSEDLSEAVRLQRYLRNEPVSLKVKSSKFIQDSKTGRMNGSSKP